MQVLTLRGRKTFFAVLAALALPARALDFGEVEVLSAIGEKLDARIPIRAASGEWFHVTCLALSGGAGAAALADGTVSVERRSRSANLRVRSSTPVNEPAVTFSVTSSCAAGAPPTSRQFAALVDLPRVTRAPEARKASSPEAARPRGSPQAAPELARETGRAAPAPPAHTSPPRSPAPAQPARAETPATQAPAAPAGAPRRPVGGEFVLRLSSDPIDVSRSRAFDDKSRAVLRERLRLLDNDDQVAAMLQLRDNMQRLEARVAELQLKLATATQAAPKVEATAPPPPRTQPAPSGSAPAPQGVAKAPAPTHPPARAPASAAQEDEWAPGGLLPWLGGLALLLILAGAWLWKRRPRRPREQIAAVEEPATVFVPAPRAMEEEPPIEIAAPVHAPADARPVAVAPPAIPALAAATEDPVEALRRRYIEERFPEIRDRTIVLDDPASVVKGARLFYEDGSLPRAVELLRFATEDRPDAIRPWLALFEIYRLERLTGEYADLAGRFGARHGGSDKWEKVRAFGREIDPGNPAYAESPVNALETIGPREARRRAQAHADPIAENWLEAPMDFENEVYATELRRALMARASVEERDLVPNPMPALRSVEMFSVG